MCREPSLVAYGHSWVDGDGASERSRTFVESAGHALGMFVDNRAVGGSSSTDTRRLVAEEHPPRAAIYLLMTGLNDARLHGLSPTSAREYGSVISGVLSAFREASPHALIVVLEQPHLVDYSLFAPHNRGSDAAVDLYNRILMRTAAAVPDALYVRAPDWDALTMLSTDTVHPNDSGHAYLAREVVRAIRGSSSSSTSSNVTLIGGNHAGQR